MDSREDLYGNIALSGGITVFTGVGERMRKELMSLAPSTVKIKVGAPPPDRKTPVKRRQLTSSGLEYENDYDHNLLYYSFPWV